MCSQPTPNPNPNPNQAAKFCDGNTIFEVEPQEAVDRVKQAIELCMKFQKDYMEYKNKANIECKDNPWRVQMPALFGRLDTFLERCSDMQALALSELTPTPLLFHLGLVQHVTT